MSHFRRRRALRCSVALASVAVLASLTVADAALADETSPPSATSSSAPDPGAGSSETTEVTSDGAAATTTGAPSTAPASTTGDPSSAPAPSTSAPATSESIDPGELVPGDTVVGELVQAWPDPTADEAHHDAHAAEAPLSWIEAEDGTTVRVPTADIPAAPVGSTLAVTVGDELSDEASEHQGLAPALEVREAAVVSSATPDPTTAGAGSAATNDVTAVLVLPAGATPDGTTISSVVSTLNGSVSAFWDEQSNGAVRIAAVQGAATWVSSPYTCADPTDLWNDIATRIGWTGGSGEHLMLYVPDNAAGCAYGLGTVGSSVGSGGRSYVKAVALSVMAHELGHNFGLGHSSEYQCDGAVETGTCRTRDYYDFYDVMGISWSQVGSLNVAQAARLGLLPASEQTSFTPTSAATSVALAPAAASSGTRAIKLTASGVVYYLEYRQASGQDAWLGDSRNAYGLSSGVTLRKARSGSNTSLLLDGSPSTSAGWNSDMQQALPVGTAVPVAGGAFTVTVSGVSASSASVQVVGAQAPAPAPQSQASSPVGTLDGVVAVGQNVTISGWAVDPDAASTSIQVHVYIDGRGMPMVANGSRSEADSVSGAGSAHGFGWTPVLDPGRHDICVYAIDVSRGPGNTVLGCRSITVAGTPPVGVVDTLTVTGTQLEVAGWAFDVDAPQQNIQVHVYVDGRGTGLVASRDSATGALTTGHRFRWQTTLGAGPHQVCLYALDAVPGQPNTTLTCQAVTVVTSSPVGALDSLTVTSTGVQVTGWAMDPDAPQATAQVHMYVDGRGAVLLAGDTSSTAAVTSHRFTGVMSAAAGDHQVCVYAIDVTGGPGNTQLACRSIRVG